MRLPALLLIAALLPLSAHAGEVDLTRRRSRPHRPPKLVLRAEGGNIFAPYGLAGACLSYLTAGGIEFEAGAGAGFPGLQLGVATRLLSGDEGNYFVVELAVAGNTRVNRGFNEQDRFLDPAGASRNSSLWSSLGLGFEVRSGHFDLSLVAAMAVTTTSFTPNFEMHGGIGFGF